MPIQGNLGSNQILHRTLPFLAESLRCYDLAEQFASSKFTLTCP